MVTSYEEVIIQVATFSCAKGYGMLTSPHVASQSGLMVCDAAFAAAAITHSNMACIRLICNSMDSFLAGIN